MRTDKKILADALKKLKGVTTKGSVLPSYQGILMQNGSMTATNGSYTVKLPVECDCPDDIIIMPDAMNLLFNLPDGDVDIELVDKTVKIRGGAVKANFKTLDAAEFVKMSTMSNESAFLANWTELKEKLSSVLFACSKNNEKPIMRGVHLFTRDGALHMLGCNGYMLAWEKLDYSAAFNAGESVEIDCVIDCDTLWKLIELCDGEDLRITMEKSRIAFETEKLEMQSRLLDGVYPKVDGFVPEYANTAMVNMPGLIAMIRRVCALAETVVIDASEDKLSISCSAEGIEYNEEIELATNLKTPLRVKFAAKLCYELFNAFKSYEEAEIGFDSGTSAAVKPMTIKAGTMVSMLLPIRLEG